MKALAVVALVLAILLHPAVLLALLALELAAITLITAGCLRAAGVRVRLRRWEPWTP